MSQSQSIVILSSSCTGSDTPSNDSIDSPESCMSHPLSCSSSSYLQSLPIVCDILMLPELPDETIEALSMSQKRLNPCGIDNVLWMHNVGQNAMLMSLTSCHLVAAANETNQVVLPVEPIPSTFVIDAQKQTSAVNPVPNLDVSFGFDIALQQWREFLKVASTASMTNEEGRIREPLQKSSNGNTQAGCTVCKDSCDLTLEPFYQDLIRSSFQHSATKGSFVSDNPEMVFKQLQMMTEKEAQDLDRIMKGLGIVGVCLLGLLWWSGREMFRASHTECIQIKRIQNAIQEMEQEVHCEQNRCNVASPAVAARSPRRGLSFVTTSPPQQDAIQEMEQEELCEESRCNASSPAVPARSPSRGLSLVTPSPPQQVAGERPICGAPAPLQEAPQEESVRDTPPTVLLSQEKAEDPFEVHGLSPVENVDDSEHRNDTLIHPFEVHGLSPVEKVDDSEHRKDTPIQSEEDGSDLPEETQVQFEENESQECESDEESAPVLLLLTTSLSINRKHVVHQERMKTILESNKLDQVDIVDGADPSKKALRNALFQLSGLRAVYPQLFVSRGSKLRFVGDMEKVQHLHDERSMTKEDIFDSKRQDWHYLEDIISAASFIDESFAYQEISSSTSTEHENRGVLYSASNLESESQSTSSLAADTNSEDSIQSGDSISPSSHEVSSDVSEANSITDSGGDVNGQDACRDESMHSTDSVSTPYQQTFLPPPESYNTPSSQANSDSDDGGEDSIHSTDSVSSARTRDASSASTPSDSSNRSLSPFSKMAKAWEERRLGRGKSSRPARSKLQPLALKWNTGTDLFSKTGGASARNDQDAPKELSSTNTEISGSKTKLVPSTEQAPTVHAAPCKMHYREDSLDPTAEPPSLEVTYSSSPGSQQEHTSFVEDYWW